MDKGAVLEAIRFMEQCLEVKGLNISKLILFGSHAKGEAASESDIDIAIISKDFRNKDIFERAQMTKDAEILTIRKFLVPLDVITLTPEEFESETSLVAGYAREGEVVYGA